MKLSVIKEKANPFMRRKEVMAEIMHDGMPTPSAAALEELASQQLGAEKEKIEIKSIFSEYGTAKSKLKIFIWDEKKPDAKKKENPVAETK